MSKQILFNDHFQNFKKYNLHKAQLIIDPTAGSGSTLVAALELNRKAYGFEIDRNFFKAATKWIDEVRLRKEEIKTLGYAKTEISKKHPILF